jgi:hypothetical protein
MSKTVKTVQGEKSFMAFPAEKQAALEQASQRRRSPTPAPIARPIADGPRQQQGPQHAARPPVQIHAPAGAQVPNDGFGWLGNQPPAQAPQPVAAVMSNQPMAHPVSYQAPAPQAPMMAPQQGTVKNVMPGFESAIADGESMSLALPSRFAYYGFRDCYVQPFRARHLAKLQKAHREQSLLPIVEAVSAVMFTTEPTYAGRALAFDLSLPDFYMVLYWLRMNSFTKSNYIHRTRCTNAAHIEQVAKGEVSEDTLKIEQVITKSQLEVIELENIPDPATYHFSDASAMIFRPPTMKDVVEFSEAPELQDDDQREEFTYLAQLATHIQHRDLELSLAQRVEIVKDATADQVELIQAFERELGDFGVIDKVEVQCKHCGQSQKTKLNIAAHSFFQ